MKMVRNRMLAACMIAGLPLGLAQADIPDVLDRVPADAPVIITMGNVNAFFDQADAFTGTLQNPEAKQGLEMARMMLSMEGIDANGSAAIVLTTIEDLDESKQPPVVVLMPVSDYAAVCTALGGTGNGLEQLNIEGEEVYMMDLGDGYAAAAPTMALLEGFDGADGNDDAHETAMGAVGDQMAKDNAVLIIANMDQLRGPMLEGWAEGKETMREGMGMGMGVDPEQIAAQISMMDQFVNAFAEGAERGMLGMSGGEYGFSVEFGINFKDDSEFAGTFQESGDADDLLAKLPGGEYFFAYAMDYSSEGLKSAMQKMNSLSEDQAQIPGMNPGGLIDTSNGTAAVLGISPSGLMGGGLFTALTTVMTSDDPDALIETYGNQLSEANDQVASGYSMTTSFAPTEDAGAGENVHRWSIQLLPELGAGGMGQQGAMMMNMLFGPTGGPGGYIAKADDDTVVMTYSTRSSMLDKAVTAATEGGEFDDNKLVQNQNERLHDDAFMLAYVDVGAMIRTVSPMMAMFMPGAPQLNVPEEVTPIAMSMASENGGVRFRTVVPQDFIELTRELGEAFGGMGGGMGGPGGQEEPPSF